MAEDEQAANAARIVKCVNACAGIENPAEAISAAREALEALLSASQCADETGYVEGCGFVDMETIQERASKALAQLKGGAA